MATMMEQETVLALVEAKESLERALDRLRDDNPGSARSHISHAMALIESMLAKGR
jgi:hypothetical protein